MLRLRTPSVKECPFRSPQAVCEAVKDLIRDKVVCELGCAEGDNMAFMAKYAKKVIGMEYDPERCKYAMKRKFEVTLGDYYKDEIPEADVYYFWPNDGERDNEYLVNKILNKPNFKGVIIVGGDTGFPPEVPSVKRCAKKGKLLEVPFNEGTKPRQSGIFLLAIIDRREMQQCILVLSNPRSGSSATMGCLYLCGISLGNNITKVKDQFNAKGYFENQKILSFNTKVLNDLKITIHTPELLSEEKLEKSLTYKNELKNIISTEFAGTNTFAIKDPRIIILYELYKSVFEELNIFVKILKIVRNINAIAPSVNRMNHIPLSEAKDMSRLYYRLIEMIRKDKDSIEISFEDLVKDPLETVKIMCSFAGVGFAPSKEAGILHFIDKNLVHFI